MNHKRATVAIAIILALVALALVGFGSWAVLNGETGAGQGTGPTGSGTGQRVAATNAFE
ncbi:hypothetical protein ACFVU2_16585 [Leifsonia sp. NPDC058194]|uniref:hypothetical protein n=1 Tax=Leifsonia sp. NPDC058194 TaxID=3346374 RepID=UPI0036D8321D